MKFLKGLRSAVCRSVPWRARSRRTAKSCERAGGAAGTAPFEKSAAGVGAGRHLPLRHRSSASLTRGSPCPFVITGAASGLGASLEQPRAISLWTKWNRWVRCVRRGSHRPRGPPFGRSPYELIVHLLFINSAHSKLPGGESLQF